MTWAVTATAQDDGVRGAIELARDGKFDEAHEIAEEQGPVAADLVRWLALGRGYGTFDDYFDFLTRNAHWPGLSTLRARGEATLGPSVTPDHVREFFGSGHARSAHGALYLADALRADGLDDEARSEIVVTFRTRPFSRSEQAIFMREFAELLAPHVDARLDLLLWQGQHAQAERMYPFLSPGQKALAQARVALRKNQGGVDGKIAAVPKDLRDHPGLAFERFLWRLERGRRASAEELLVEQSGSADMLGEPEYWASWRRVLARDALFDGRTQASYDLAANHFLVSGNNFADLEFLAGYIALKLDRPGDALAHFRRLRAGAESPITLGRAGYWEARAYDALDRPDDAQAAREFAAEYQTGFYGILAAEEAGVPMSAEVAEVTGPVIGPGPDLAHADLLTAALMLRQAGEEALAARFVTHLAESLSPEDQVQLGDLVVAIGANHIAVALAKRAASDGLVLARPYFPLDEVPQIEGVPPELALSIIRRESEFRHDAVSPAGARGLMQLMPGTAREVAGWLEVNYDSTRLLDDPSYNAQLGTAYLASLMREFDGNVLLVASAYNAGPGRTRRWLKTLGDPRDPSVDPLDWIESIPFRETRNYVMRVAESVVIYRARLAGEVQPIRLGQELAR